VQLSLMKIPKDKEVATSKYVKKYDRGVFAGGIALDRII
jgi:hypothetical protein